MEGGNFHLIFTRRCPRTFCSTLRYHAIFEGTIEEAPSHFSADLSYIHLETPAEAIYRSGRAREISSRSGLATPKTIATPDLSSYFTITSRCASQLRSSFPFPP